MIGVIMSWTSAGETPALGLSNSLATELWDPFRSFTCTHKPYYGKVSLTCLRDLEPGLINNDAGRGLVCHAVIMPPVHRVLLAR
jgi:hypothetical protein